MTAFRVMAIAFVALCVGRDVGAQQQALQSRLDPATLEALRPVFEQARRDSLPVRALEAKALEGAAKQRSGAEILLAVRLLATELGAARRGLRRALPGGLIRDGEVVAAVEAMRQRVPVEEIVTLRREAPPDAVLEIPFAVMGELVQRGVAAGQAREVIQQLVTSGVPQARMIEIPQRLDAALRVGAPPVTALGSALQGLGIPVPPLTPGRPDVARPRPPIPNP